MSFPRGVSVGEDAEGSEALFEGDRIIGDARLEEAEIVAMKLRVDLLGAAEVEHGDVALSIDEEVAGMRVGVELLELVDLKVVEVPNRLGDGVAAGGISFFVGETVERPAVDPVHGEDAAIRELGVVAGEAQPGDAAGGGLREGDGALDLKRVVRFLQQAAADLLKVGRDVGLSQAEHLECDGFHHSEIAVQAVGHAGILDLHGITVAVLGGAVDLADGGAVGGGLREGVKQFERLLAELAAEGADDERVRQRWGGVLGLGELRAEGGGEEIAVDAEHLRDLERAAFELGEGVVDGAGVCFVECGPVRTATDGAASVVPEVVDSDAGTGTRESGHAGGAGGGDRVLIGRHGGQCPEAWPQLRPLRKRIRSKAESTAWVPMTSKARRTDFSM